MTEEEQQQPEEIITVDPTQRWCFHRGGPKMECDDQGCPWALHYYRTRLKQTKLALKFAEGVIDNRIRPDPHAGADVNSLKDLIKKVYEPVPRPDPRNPFEKEADE